MLYRSTQTYTVEKFTDMGVELNRVTDSNWMVVAILTNDEFAQQFEEIPQENEPSA